MKKPVALSLMSLTLAFAFAGCAKSGDSQPVLPQHKNSNDPALASSEDKTEHVLQLTVLNFLSGGIESCGVKNKLITFTKQDNLTVRICQNSKVKVFAVSHSGIVVFHAIDKVLGRELPPSGPNDKADFELGKTKEMLRYSVENPYGFTYIMAEDVTGIDVQLLAQWNKLNSELSNLQEQALITERSGKKAPKKILDRMQELERKLFELQLKIKSTMRK